MSWLGASVPYASVHPFGRRIDDDVACWEPRIDAERVLIVHDFASPGWERREQFTNVYEWLRKAIDDLIEFE